MKTLQKIEHVRLFKILFLDSIPLLLIPFFSVCKSQHLPFVYFKVSIILMFTIYLIVGIIMINTYDNSKQLKFSYTILLLLDYSVLFLLSLPTPINKYGIYVCDFVLFYKLLSNAFPLFRSKKSMLDWNKTYNIYILIEFSCMILSL